MPSTMLASTLAIAALCSPAANAITLTVSAALQAGGFEKFIAFYQRDYTPGSREYARRKNIFETRAGLMEKHNAQHDRLWTAGVSHLTDRSDEELQALYGWKGHAGGRQVASLLDQTVTSSTRRTLASSIDWNNLTMVQKRRDQGSCGSCWAVAAATMLEARHEAQLGKTRGFSAQQLVNCVPNPKECGGQGGCAGATVELAVKYAAESGLDDEAAGGVPYTGSDGVCAGSGASSFLGLRSRSSSHSNTKLSLESWDTLPLNKAEPLMQALAEGPVAISVGADGWSSYSSGIFNSCVKDVVINHAVVLMGYGEDSGTKYWNIRNSWGRWGESGHIRLLRQDTIEKEDTLCGWDHKPGDGIACKPYPEKQYVCGMCGLLFDSVAVKFSADAAVY